MVRQKKADMSKVLVVAVHPDDETLGCGGTLLRHKAEGDEIHWLICTDIEAGHVYHEKRENEIRQAAECYGFKSVHRLGLHTTKVDTYSVSELVSGVSEVIGKVCPDVLYLPFMGDIHSDHRHIFNAVLSCTKSFRYPFIKSVMMMETLSETEFAPAVASESFIPNIFVNITDYFEEKLALIDIYESETGVHPFPRSRGTLEALAKFRGAVAGCEYAEGFMLIKAIR